MAEAVKQKRTRKTRGRTEHSKHHGARSLSGNVFALKGVPNGLMELVRLPREEVDHDPNCFFCRRSIARVIATHQREVDRKKGKTPKVEADLVQINGVSVVGLKGLKTNNSG